MKTRLSPFVRVAALSITGAISLSALHAENATLLTGTYTGTQTYNNGVIGQPNANIVTFGSGANYTFDSLYVSFAWNRMVLNSGATLNVGGNLIVDLSGVSLNGGTLTAGGLQLHDGPDGWDTIQNDGKQTMQPADSIINGSTIIANQSNANFISFVGSSSAAWADEFLANNLWLGNDGATVNSNGHNIGITMAMGNFSGQTGSLTKIGAGTLTLSARSSYTGGTTVNAGTLELSGATNGNGLLRGAVTVNSGGTIAITGGDGTGFGWNSPVTSLNINGGTVNASSGSHIGFGAYTTVVLGNGGTIAGNWKWNGDSLLGFSSSGDSTNTISGNLLLRSDDGANHTFNVANGAAAVDLQVTANLSDKEFEWQSASVLVKTGEGTMELSGTNSYHGDTQVNAGKLVVNGNNSTSSLTTVAGGATLAGTGTIGAAIVNGIFSPGNSIGTINVQGTLDLNGISNFEIDPTLGTGLNRAADLANVTGAISYGGILNVLYGGSSSDFISGMTFNLFDASLGFSDSFTSINLPTLTGDMTWQNDLATTGSITVVPEPRAALIGGLGVFALLRRRRSH